MKSAQYWIDQLELIGHPEGGYFKEVHRSTESIAAEGLPNRYIGERSFATHIYFLVTKTRFSAFHRLQTEEIWHFYTGSPLTIDMILADGSTKQFMLGNEPEKGQSFQAIVPENCWFAASVDEGYALCGCTMAPGFDFADFELASKTELQKAYPNYVKMIDRLTY